MNKWVDELFRFHSIELWKGSLWLEWVDHTVMFLRKAHLVIYAEGGDRLDEGKCI